MEIARTYHVDVELSVEVNREDDRTHDEIVEDLATELAFPNQLTWYRLGGGLLRPVLRFIGARGDIERLIKSIRGASFVYTPPQDHDFATAEDRTPVGYGDPNFEG